MSHERRTETLQPSNRIRSRRPEAPRSPYREVTTPQDLFPYFTDASRIIRGGTERVIIFPPESTASDIAHIVQGTERVIPVGARSAITGAASPDNQVVIDVSRRDRILAWGRNGENTVTVQTGITIRKLQEALKERGLYYPPAPTFDGAEVGGTIATNAAGAATFKYGQTRLWIDAITVVLANGEILDIERGKHKVKGGEFEWQDADGNIHKIPVPTYTMPDVPKISAGYYSGPEMDLIDLFIGSEGTLGVITEARLKLIPRPAIMWALVYCISEEQAIELTGRLRNASLTTWVATDPDGLDVSAIEYIDEKSVELLRDDSKIRDEIDPPKNATTLLLVQIETSKEKAIQETQLDKFAEILQGLDLLDRTEIADQGAQKRIEYYVAMREAVPDGVNRRVGEKKKKDTGISKTAGDMIVPFEHLAKMMRLFRAKFSGDYDLYIWGHASDGNMHANVVPQSSEQAQTAGQILMDCGLEVINLGGSPLSEHGVGKNPIKQALLEAMYGKQGIDEMRRIKEVLDPTGKLSAGNIFTLN